jgi:hypothetical protein
VFGDCAVEPLAYDFIEDRCVVYFLPFFFSFFSVSGFAVNKSGPLISFSCHWGTAHLHPVM